MSSKNLSREAYSAKLIARRLEPRSPRYPSPLTLTIGINAQSGFAKAAVIVPAPAKRQQPVADTLQKGMTAEFITSYNHTYERKV